MKRSGWVRSILIYQRPGGIDQKELVIRFALMPGLFRSPFEEPHSYQPLRPPERQAGAHLANFR